MSEKLPDDLPDDRPQLPEGSPRPEEEGLSFEEMREQIEENMERDLPTIEQVQKPREAKG